MSLPHFLSKNAALTPQDDLPIGALATLHALGIPLLAAMTLGLRQLSTRITVKAGSTNECRQSVQFLPLAVAQWLTQAPA